MELLFPFLDLKAQFATIRDEVMAAVTRVMESQQFILGKEGEGLEWELAQRVGVSAAVGCASGTDALILALQALGVGAGDEVVTPPFTFIASAGAIARLGAKPVFIDIQPDTFNLDPNQIERALSGRTRAILPVHLFGLAADLDPILEVARAHRLPVVEDAAQSIDAGYRGSPGSKVGSLGAVGCFSFFPSKNLGGAGEGGLLTTNDPELADRFRLLRDHGSRQRYSFEVLGTNSRLDEIQAAILRVKLRHLDAWTAARRRNAQRYAAIFKDRGLGDRVKLPVEPPGFFHVYNQFTVRCSERDRLREFLRRRGIPSQIYYPLPLHLQPAFSYLGHRAGEFPESEKASREVLSFPIYPELSNEQQTAVGLAIAEFYDNARVIKPWTGDCLAPEVSPASKTD
ncbi:MAG TPA: DegT/DnrJ/EryC1/StrS family aminotransferase [Terriglobia bacterium]|nr:DegT/DnrJ/EryC1/StrS family aminotransferase [Terriglobia bacterium]